MTYLFIGIIIGYLTAIYITPILDIIIELIGLKANNIGTKINCDTQSIAKEFDIKYPLETQIQEQNQTQAIGFAVPQEEYYEDFED
jgi:hypothetical protein